MFFRESRVETTEAGIKPSLFLSICDRQSINRRDKSSSSFLSTSLSSHHVFDAWQVTTSAVSREVSSAWQHRVSIFHVRLDQSRSLYRAPNSKRCKIDSRFGKARGKSFIVIKDLEGKENAFSRTFLSWNIIIRDGPWISLRLVTKLKVLNISKLFSSYNK